MNELTQNRLKDATIACLLIPHFALRVEVLRHPAWDGMPLALANLAEGNRRRLIDCSPEAASQGLRAGMLVREALSLCPGVTVITADPVHYATVFASMLRDLHDVSPALEPGDPGVIYVDLRGLGRHYAGPEVAGMELLAAIPAQLRPRLGISSNKFTALVAAHQAEAGGIRMVSETRAAKFLAGCPVDLLPVAEKMKLRLHRLGLNTLGDITRLSSGAMQAQFGSEGRRAWELAHGKDDAPFSPAEIPAPVVERVTLPAPAIQIDTLLTGVYQLVSRLLRRPELRDNGVRKLSLRLVLEGYRSWQQEIVLKGAVREVRRLMLVLSSCLGRAVIEAAVEEIILEATEITPVHARQQQLGIARRWQEENLQEALRELSTRYGASPLYQAVEVEPWSRIPERRWALLPFEPSTSPGRSP